MDTYSWGQSAQEVTMTVRLRRITQSWSQGSTFRDNTVHWKILMLLCKKFVVPIYENSIENVTGSNQEKMYLKSNLSWNVVIPANKMGVKGLMLQKSIITQLMEAFAAKRASKDLGFFLAITTVKSIGDGKVRQHSGDVLFPVDFTCITFRMIAGEVLEGTVTSVMKHGVFLSCGPAAGKVFLFHQKMADYQYVPGENPYFMNVKSARIEKGALVRFVVLGEKFMEAEKDFQVVASLEGDYLGPVS